MNIHSFLRRYGAEILMISLSVGLGTWFSLPRQRIKTIQLPDTLRVITLYGSTTYFEHLGEKLGYQYSLVRMLSDSIGKPLSIRIASSLEEIHQALTDHEVDLSITPEPMSQNLAKHYAFVGPEQRSAIVLVQRKRNKLDRNSERIDNVTELLDKSIYVLANSRYEQRLNTLSEQLGGKILPISTVPDSLRLQDSIPHDDFINLVSLKLIDYALIDKELANVATRYYPNVDMSLEIGFPQRLQWLVHAENAPLIKAIKTWTKTLPELKAARKHIIYRKYLEAHRPEASLLTASYRGEHNYIASGRISPFDYLFKEEAARLGWPWEVLASIAYQESNFTPDIIGRSGARGLMGIMPRTGKSFGATAEELLEPEVSVRVSVDCLLAFSKYFKDVEDIDQRMKLTLAAYNAGIAHIQDAQRLAEKYGSDPKRWDNNVDEYIRLKSDPQYYRDPVCRYGYLRGGETYNYVSKVTSRAQMYQAYTSKH